MNMDFDVNKTPVEVIKEGTVGGTYFRDTCSGVNNKWYKNLWKEFDDLKNIDQNYDVMLINMVLHLEHH